AAGEKTLASPAVRSFAREAGVELDAVAGSGKGGRVTRADVQAAGQAAAVHLAAGHAPAPAPTPTALPAVQAPAWAGAATGQDEVVKIIGLRRKIAEKMVESYTAKPHFTYVDEVDATELVALRTALKAQAAARGVSLTYLPFILKALAVVFRQFPTVNSTLDEKTMEMTIHGSVHIGIATDTPAGLYVPVVKHVEQKSILELAAEVAALTERTRLGKVALDDLQGGTFTVTSVGNIGGRFATPIINAPECAILGVNQIHDRPVVKDGQVVARKMMYLSPSFDHRVLDGAVAARFTSALKEVLENPAAMLLELR
ncbi:2-oxo acid dehydrogenase subunit E2, partial [Myxococcota bacterium]|nr:2-oxo acid dehydrogenase subunit E2 [Myxococcota bacterium]